MDPELLSLDRLPLPSLKVYTCLSFLAASFSMYYIGTESGSALKKLSDAHDSCQFNLLVDHTAAAILDKKPDNLLNSPLDSATPSFSHSLGLFARYLANEYWWPHEESGGERVGGTGDNNNASQQKNVTESDCLNEDYQQLTWQLLHWASQQPHCVWVRNCCGLKFYNFFNTCYTHVICRILSYWTFSGLRFNFRSIPSSNFLFLPPTYHFPLPQQDRLLKGADDSWCCVSYGLSFFIKQIILFACM